jgi:hypothetical protein
VAFGWATTPRVCNLNLMSTSPTWHPPLPMREGDYDYLHFLVHFLDLLLLSVGFLNGFKGYLSSISKSLTLKKRRKTLFYILKKIPLFNALFACLNQNLFVDVGDSELRSYGVLVQRGAQDAMQSK